MVRIPNRLLTKLYESNFECNASNFKKKYNTQTLLQCLKKVVEIKLSFC